MGVDVEMDTDMDVGTGAEMDTDMVTDTGVSYKCKERVNTTQLQAFN